MLFASISYSFNLQDYWGESAASGIVQSSAAYCTYAYAVIFKGASR
jgi:hypothetical protein